MFNIKALYALRDVLISSPTNGQVLTYDSATGLWKNAAGGGGGGSGTVTSVSVVTANGFTGSVANATTTPAITLTYTGPSGSSTIVNDTTTNAVMYPTWVTATSGNLPIKVSSTGLSFNPSTNSLLIGNKGLPIAHAFEVVNNQNAETALFVTNTSAGTSAMARIILTNSDPITDTPTPDDYYMSIHQTGRNFTAGGVAPFYANRSYIVSGGTSNGLFSLVDAGIYQISMRRNTGTLTTDLNYPDLYITDGTNASEVDRAHILIGTSTDNTTVKAKIQIHGKQYIDDALIIGNGSAVSQNEKLRVDQDLTGAAIYAKSAILNNPAFIFNNTNTTASASVAAFITSSSGGSTTNVSIENNGAGTFMIRTGATTEAGFGSSRFTITSSGICTAVTSLTSPVLYATTNLSGGVSSGGNLTLTSTDHATKGKIIFGSASAYDQVNDRLGIGTTSPSQVLHLVRAGAESTIVLNSTGGSGQEWNLRSLNANGRFIFTNNSTSTNAFIIEPTTEVIFNKTVTSTGLIFSNTSINTTAGDSATINASAGRFRKDTSGSTFTLTNSFITANSIFIHNFASDPGVTGFDMFHVCGSGSVVITFTTSGVAAAPTNNTDVDFVVIN